MSYDDRRWTGLNFRETYFFQDNNKKSAYFAVSAHSAVSRDKQQSYNFFRWPIWDMPFRHLILLFFVAITWCTEHRTRTWHDDITPCHPVFTQLHICNVFANRKKSAQQQHVEVLGSRRKLLTCLTLAEKIEPAMYVLKNQKPAFVKSLVKNNYPNM